MRIKLVMSTVIIGLFGALSSPMSIAALNQLIGGCVQPKPAILVDKIGAKSGKIQFSEEYHPFTKSLEVDGITLVATNDISNRFMEQVANTIESMFPASKDSAKQKQLIDNLARYKALIPVFKGEPDIEGMGEEHFERLITQNSVCDIIMSDVDGQVMEVVEHILHIVTDVGLHYTFKKEWGLSRHSKLYQSMQQAIAKGYYSVDSYGDIDEKDERLRVELQEYAYWLISTAWNLQEPYGPNELDEWSIRNSAELEAKLPMAYQLYQDTVAKVLSAPNKATLKVFN